MMYLTEIKLFEVSKKQYFYKLKTSFQLFFSLMVVQLLGVLLSQTSSSGGSYSATLGISFNTSSISGNAVMFFTIIWAFMVSIMLPNKNNKNIDFTFISNRLTSNISNIGFLLTLSLYASITAALCNSFLRILIYFTTGSTNIVDEGFFVSPKFLFINIISMFLYIILVMSIGYFLGSLEQFHHIASLLFVVTLFLDLLIYIFIGFGKDFKLNYAQQIFDFYVKENSLLIFTLKVLITAIIFFSSSLLLSNSLEVRK